MQFNVFKYHSLSRVLLWWCHSTISIVFSKPNIISFISVLLNNKERSTELYYSYGVNWFTKTTCNDKHVASKVLPSCFQNTLHHEALATTVWLNNIGKDNTVSKTWPDSAPELYLPGSKLTSFRVTEIACCSKRPYTTSISIWKKILIN